MSDKASICIVSQSHLCRNPRVLKEAVTLSAAGYGVTVLTAIYSDELLKEDLSLIHNKGISYEFYSDLRSGGFTPVKNRAVKRIATLLQTKFKFETIYSLGTGVSALMKRCKVINAGLYIMHQELATCTGTKLIKKGYQVAFDLEDWYSQDLLPEARKKRPLKLLRKAESFALHRGSYCTTTSNTMAKKLGEVYICTAPAVIYNVFAYKNNLPGKAKDFLPPIKLFWFSQTIGHGRGLGQFIKLTRSLKNPLELHLLGHVDPGYLKKLNKLMPKQHQLYFHELVEGQNLAEKIAQFDIGLALELDKPLSRNYTITNKFFQYLQAGIPVIASATEGQNEGFEKFKQGFKLPQQPWAEEIAQLDKWLNDPVELEAARQRAIAAARFYNWENESEKLLALVKEALEK